MKEGGPGLQPVASVTLGAQTGQEDGALAGGPSKIRPLAVQDSPEWIAKRCQAPWKRAIKRKPLLPASPQSTF